MILELTGWVGINTRKSETGSKPKFSWFYEMISKSISILLIEDEVPHAELIQRAFEGQDNRARIHHVLSLADARTYLQSHIPDLIIADWRLPDGDSLKLLSPGDDQLSIPIIFMTSYGNERIAVEALKSGATDYVVKSPESMADMPHIVERAIEQDTAKRERSRMQQALAESEAQFRLLAEYSSDMITRHDIKGKFIYISPACRGILGYEPEELIGRPALNLVHPEDLAGMKAMVNPRPREDSVYTVAFRARQKDGQYVWLETTARAILDANTGNVIEIHATSRDITERKLAEEALKAAHLELQEAYDRTIEGWVRALDLRDRETEGHTQRVTEMTVKIACTLGFSDTEITNIRRGALLHDIGKIAISDEITKKTGPLNHEEWEEMRKHPQYAFEMLSPITYLHPALDIPYCHHERLDGSGYPRGLRGEEIPLTARLFAIIDVWDALISDRPYRKGAPQEKAIVYLKEESGKLFDERLVEAFLQVLEQQSEEVGQ